MKLLSKTVASASGDPHYYTFDRMVHHYQGHRCYVVSRVTNINNNNIAFELQAEHLKASRSSKYRVQKTIAFGIPQIATFQASFYVL